MNVSYRAIEMVVLGAGLGALVEIVMRGEKKCPACPACAAIPAAPPANQAFSGSRAPR